MPSSELQTMKIYVKKVEGITLPEKKTPLSAGYDVKATSEPNIVGEQYPDGTWKRIDYIEFQTNLYLAPEVKTAHLDLRPRSSISKYNLVLANSIGLLDNDYRGMVLARFSYTWQPEDLSWGLQNEKNCIFGSPNLSKIYKMGDDIAQLVGAMTIDLEFEVADNLDQTQRGEGGFGHTDNKNIIAIKKSAVDNMIKLEKEQKEVPPLASQALNSHITELYSKAGGISVRERYSEEVKKRTEI